MSLLGDAQVEAVAEALRENPPYHCVDCADEDDDGTPRDWATETVHVVLSAALPLVAQKIENEAATGSWSAHWTNGLLQAAGIVRAARVVRGTTNQGEAPKP